MRGLLKSDLIIKIISVFFAVILWFSVLDKNVNPVETINLNIPLKIRNEEMLKDKGLGLKSRNYPQTIVITVKARKMQLDNITVNDFDAVLDFTRISSVNDRVLPVNLARLKENVSIEAVKPNVVNLELERIIEKSFKVEVVPTGNIKKNYKILRASVNPDIISVEGLESYIKSAAFAKAYVDVTNLDKDISIKKECKVMSPKGEEIVGISKDLSVDVFISVAKEVPIIPAINGSPGRGLIAKESFVQPSKALITGPAEVLANTSQITTSPVNISSYTGNIHTQLDLLMPEGLKLVDTPKKVWVDVTFDRILKKELALSKEMVAIQNEDPSNELKYEIMNLPSKIVLKGKEMDLSTNSALDLKPSVDVDGLPEGQYTKILKLELPKGIELENKYSVIVKVYKK